MSPGRACSGPRQTPRLSVCAPPAFQPGQSYFLFRTTNNCSLQTLRERSSKSKITLRSQLIFFFCACLCSPSITCKPWIYERISIRTKLTKQTVLKHLLTQKPNKQKYKNVELILDGWLGVYRFKPRVLHHLWIDHITKILKHDMAERIRCKTCVLS